LPSQPSRYARRKPSKGRPASRGWITIGVIIAVAVVVLIAIIRGLGPHGGGTPAARTPVPAAVMQELAQIPDATWNAVAAKGAVAPVMVQALKPAAKPTFLYIGAEFCPYCAAERWSMVTALARFGTFQSLSYTASATNDVDPSTPTFSFYGSTYTSSLVDLQTVETTTNVPQGNGYQPLQTPTQAQQNLFGKYDAPPYFANSGSIPFVLIGGTYAWQGASYDPALLSNTTQAAVAAQLAAGTSPAAKAILANANVMTAAICATDGEQPAAVCGSAGVKAGAALLPTKVKS
jgi:hypothetical protein